MRNLKEKRPGLATVLAGLALMIALGGTATAASGLINGKKIKNNTIAGKKIKNKTITKAKIAPATVTALRGAQGPKGPAGPAGKDGVVNPEFGAASAVALPANVETSVASINVAPGEYVVTSTARLASNGTGNMACFVKTNDGEGSASSTWKSPAAGSTNTVPVDWLTEKGVTSIELRCHPGNIAGTADATLIAIPVG